MQKNKILRPYVALGLLIVFGLYACGSPTPQIIEVTRQVQSTVVVTQVITQIVTPEYTPTPEPTPTFTPPPTQNSLPAYTPLENCPASFLRRGFHVMVSYDGGSNAIRPSPDLTSAAIIGYAIPGEVIKIIGGPVCNYGWLVWQVETQYGLQGWTPETDGTDYWLIPVVPVTP
jgi:hypothetical protein